MNIWCPSNIELTLISVPENLNITINVGDPPQNKDTPIFVSNNSLCSEVRYDIISTEGKDISGLITTYFNDPTPNIEIYTSDDALSGIYQL